jgi:sigma-E factor negative regulatory protein RseC
MIEETGTVKSVDGIMAKVLISRRSSCCEKCEKDQCDIPETGIETEAINEAGARVGQKVKVVMKARTYIKGALLIYIIPVIALFAGAVGGKIYLPAFITVEDTDILAAAGGFLAFILSILLAKIISGRMSRKTEYKPVIESILEE